MRSFSSFTVLPLALIGGLMGCGLSDADPHLEATEGQMAKLQQDIDDVVARTPGARQISVNEVEMAPGLQMRLAMPGEATPQVKDDLCTFKHMCAWEGSNFTGHKLDFVTCGREWNLRIYAFPGGGTWADKISSIINNQTPGTKSFYYAQGTNGVWKRIFSVPDGTFFANLALDQTEGTTDPNNHPDEKIEGVHVCGVVNLPWMPNWPR